MDRQTLDINELSGAEKWDAKAGSFGTQRTLSPYAQQFIAALDLAPESRVLDMGCGNGAIAIPLAKAGHNVVARDFSKGMLAGLESEATQAGVVSKINFAQMAWEDDWKAYGIAPRSVDVAFASRSLITDDIVAALGKLSATARNYCVASGSTSYSPMISPAILREIGVSGFSVGDPTRMFSALYQLGYEPEVTYIVYDRTIHFETTEELEGHIFGAIERLSKRLSGCALTYSEE